MRTKKKEAEPVQVLFSLSPQNQIIRNDFWIRCESGEISKEGEFDTSMLKLRISECRSKATYLKLVA